MISVPICPQTRSTGPNSVHSVIISISPSYTRRFLSSKRSTSRRSWLKALITRTPGSAPVTTEVIWLHRWNRRWKKLCIRPWKKAVRKTISGIGMSTKQASFQCMKNRATPTPSRVIMAMHASTSVHATKSQMRSESLVIRVTREPVGFLLKKLRLSRCRWPYVR